MRRAGPDGEGGSTLAVVLPVLAAVFTVLFLWIRGLAPDATLASRQHAWRQAYLIAESGVWFSLYEQRLEFGKEVGGDSGRAEGKEQEAGMGSIWSPPEDSLVFRLASGITPPDRKVNLAGGWLDIASEAEYRERRVAIRARFGRTLDPNVFAPALTLLNDSTPLPLQPLQIRGRVRLKTPQPGWAAEPLGDANVLSYADAFVDHRYHRLEARLQEALGLEGHDAGNGRFDMYHMPDFTESEIWAFPLGELEIVHDGFDTLVIRGPGTLAAHGDIRVRGKVLLENLELVAGRDIVVEGESELRSTVAYGHRHLTLQGRARVEGTFVCGGNLFVRDEAQVVGASILARAGGAASDSTEAIRIVQGAQVSGFVLATGPRGRIVLGGSANTVTGILLAQEVWPAGRVHGSVVAARLRCGSGAEGEAVPCPSDFVIDRLALPEPFLQPWDLGTARPEALAFQTMDWSVR